MNVKKISLADAQEIYDNPATLPKNRERARKIIEKLTPKPKTKAQAAPVPEQTSADIPADVFAAFQMIGKDLPKSPVPVQKPANLESETQEFAHEKRPEPPAQKPKPQPYVWRDERGRTTEMIKLDMWREKQEASRSWSEAMGLKTSRPEWPGV